MKIHFSGFVCFFIGLSAVASQNNPDSSVYRINQSVDESIIAASIGVNALAFISIQNLNPRPISSLTGLEKPQLIGWDERATHQHSTFADKASDWVAGGATLLPLTLLADKDIRDEALKISVLVSETALITNGLTLATKRLVLRNRPYVFNPDFPINEKLSVESRLSFFSGHTAMSASMSFLSAKIWSDYHPGNKWKPVVWTAAATVPAVTGYLRYKAGKHYFTDVATGYAVGALVGYLVPHFHKVDRKARHKFRVSSTMDGDTPIFVFKCRL